MADPIHPKSSLLAASPCQGMVVDWGSEWWGKNLFARKRGIIHHWGVVRADFSLRMLFPPPPPRGLSQRAILSSRRLYFSQFNLKPWIYRNLLVRFLLSYKLESLRECNTRFSIFVFSVAPMGMLNARWSSWYPDEDAVTLWHAFNKASRKIIHCRWPKRASTPIVFF